MQRNGDDVFALLLASGPAEKLTALRCAGGFVRTCATGLSGSGMQVKSAGAARQLPRKSAVLPSRGRKAGAVSVRAAAPKAGQVKKVVLAYSGKHRVT